MSGLVLEFIDTTMGKPYVYGLYWELGEFEVFTFLFYLLCISEVKWGLVKKFKGSLRIRLNVRLCELLCLSVLLGLPKMLSNYSDFRLVRGYKFKNRIL